MMMMMMGLSASQARQMSLLAQKNDLELTAQQINQERLRMANQTNELFNLSSNLDPNSKESINLNLRVNAIASLDKALQLQLERVNTTYKAVDAELGSIKKIIDKSIDAIFKTFA
jgi:hypothetical protein